MSGDSTVKPTPVKPTPPAPAANQTPPSKPEAEKEKAVVQGKEPLKTDSLELTKKPEAPETEKAKKITNNEGTQGAAATTTDTKTTNPFGGTSKGTETAGKDTKTETPDAVQKADGTQNDTDKKEGDKGKGTEKGGNDVVPDNKQETGKKTRGTILPDAGKNHTLHDSKITSSGDGKNVYCDTDDKNADDDKSEDVKQDDGRIKSKRFERGDDNVRKDAEKSYLDKEKLKTEDINNKEKFSDDAVKKANKELGNFAKVGDKLYRQPTQNEYDDFYKDGKNAGKDMPWTEITDANEIAIRNRFLDMNGKEGVPVEQSQGQTAPVENVTGRPDEVRPDDNSATANVKPNTTDPGPEPPTGNSKDINSGTETAKKTEAKDLDPALQKAIEGKEGITDKHLGMLNKLGYNANTGNFTNNLTRANLATAKDLLGRLDSNDPIAKKLSETISNSEAAIKKADEDNKYNPTYQISKFMGNLFRKD